MQVSFVAICRVCLSIEGPVMSDSVQFQLFRTNSSQQHAAENSHMLKLELPIPMHLLAIMFILFPSTWLLEAKLPLLLLQQH